MSISNIVNRNLQGPSTFEFRVDKLTDFNFFVQKVNIPSLSLTAVEAGTPLVKIPFPGDHATFNELSVDFKVDEGLRNWYEIFAWIQGISFPEEQKQYGNLKTGKTPDLDGKLRPWAASRYTGDIYGQGVLTVNSSANNPLIAITFVDLHPVSLSEVVFDTTDSDITHLTCTATFKYDYYTAQKVG
jgi:hypothetical protein